MIVSSYVYSVNADASNEQLIQNQSLGYGRHAGLTAISTD